MEYLTCKQVAEIAKCSIYCVRAAVKAGKLIAFRPGKQWLFVRENVDAWIANSAVVPHK